MMNRQMIYKESLKKALKTLCIALIGAGVGVGIGKAYQPPVEPVIKYVHLPATDEQLVAFWFGNGDKTSLRKRICK